MTPFAQNVVPLHGSDAAIETDGAREREPEVATYAAPAAAPEDVDLDELMARLKALAAKAQQSPSRRNNNRRAVMATAIALSIASGAVAGQYLVAGHARPVAAPGKSFAATTASIAVSIGNGGHRAVR